MLLGETVHAVSVFVQNWCCGSAYHSARMQPFKNRLWLEKLVTSGIWVLTPYSWDRYKQQQD